MLSIGTDSNPVVGILPIPCTGVGYWHSRAMRMRDVLAENLKALMEQSPHLDRLPKITEASNRALTNGTLDRIRRAESDTDLGKLELLAAVFGLEPWQMLVPGLDPQAPPSLTGSDLLQQIQALVSDKGLSHPLVERPVPQNVTKKGGALQQTLVIKGGTHAPGRSDPLQKPRGSRRA